MQTSAARPGTIGRLQRGGVMALLIAWLSGCYYVPPVANMGIPDGAGEAQVALGFASDMGAEGPGIVASYAIDDHRYLRADASAMAQPSSDFAQYMADVGFGHYWHPTFRPDESQGMALSSSLDLGFGHVYDRVYASQTSLTSSTDVDPGPVSYTISACP